MKREKLEQYLNKKVEIQLFTGKLINGILKKCKENYNKNYYYVYGIQYNHLFRCSHVVKLKEL